MRRKRHQQGSLQIRSHGKRKMWVVLYREGGARKYETLGLFSKLSKSEAQQKQAEFMNEVNAKLAIDPDPQITFGQFLDAAALPFLRCKWKRSTASTTEDRMKHHLAEFRDTRLRAISLKTLQAFLNRKAEGLSRSSVAHLRWDLRAVFKLALAEGFIDRDPTTALYTPKEAAVEPTRAMTGKEVEQYIAALEFRERVVVHLAIFYRHEAGGDSRFAAAARKRGLPEHHYQAANLPRRHRYAKDDIVAEDRCGSAENRLSLARVDEFSG